MPYYKQVLFEYQEQFEHHHLNLKNDYENKKIICHLDSEKNLSCFRKFMSKYL